MRQWYRDNIFLNKSVIVEVLHLQKYSKDITESSHTPQIQLFLLLTSYNQHDTFGVINGPISITNAPVHSGFLSFYPLSSFCSRISSWSHIKCGRHVSLGCSWLWRFLRLSLFLMILTVLSSAGQVVCRVALGWNLSDVLLMTRLGLCVWGKGNHKKRHSHHRGSRIQTMTYYWCLPESPGWGSF